MKKLLLGLSAVLLQMHVWSQSPISPIFYGENYWFTNFNSGNPSTSADLAEWTELKNSGAKMIRVGGHNYNYDATQSKLTSPHKGSPTPVFFPQGYVTIVDNIRSRGCEPMITVPFNAGNSGGIAAEAKIAADIVRVLNIVHKRKVLYFIIANEPEEDYSGITAYTTNSPLYVRDYVKALAQAMKEVDASIKIIGPELSQNWSTYSLAQALVTGTYDITGTIPSGPAKGLRYIDYFSYHRYAGYGAAINTRADYIDVGYSQVTNPAEYDVPNLNSAVGLVVDEFNLKLNMTGSSTTVDCFTNPAQPKCSHYNGDGLTSTNYFDITEADPNAFLAGQFIVDMMAGMIKKGVAICNLWSTEENDALGFLYTNSSGTYRKPTYWHYWMMANYFKGTLYENLNVPSGTYNASTNQYRGLKAYACKSSDYIAVIVMNQHTSSLNFTVNFSNTGTGNGNFKFNMGGPTISGTPPSSIDGKSTYLLIFSCSGAYQGVYQLKQSDMETQTTAYASIPYTAAPSSSSYQPLSVSLTPTTAPCIGSNSTSASAVNALNSNVTSTATWYKLPDEVNAITPTNLSPGIYKVIFPAGGSGCIATSTVFTVHEKSPLVDAGADKTYCNGTSNTFNVGNQYLPSISPGYTWTSTSTCVPSSGANPSLSCSVSSHFVMTANDGTCQLSDDCDVYITNDAYDVLIKDSPHDVGNEPNQETNTAWAGNFWSSPSIWNRVYSDGQNEHQNPDYQPSCTNGSPPTASGPMNTIYVRLKNKGCNSITGDLDVYWTKAGTAAQWPNDWFGASCSSYLSTCTPACSGHMFAGTSTTITQPSITIAPNSEVVIPVNWCPHNPADFASSTCNSYFPAIDKGHVCIMAKFNGATGQDDLTLANGSGLGGNTYQYNNVAWKNMNVVDDDPSNFMVPTGGIIVRNIEATNMINLNFFSRADENGQTILDFARMRLHVSRGLMERWLGGGKRGRGLIAINDTVIEVEDDTAYMEKIILPYRGEEGLAIELRPFKAMTAAAADEYIFDVVQFNSSRSDGLPMGGEQYVIKRIKQADDCIEEETTLSGTISGTQTISGGTLQITDHILGPSGAVLKLENVVASIDEGVRIVVESGGALFLDHAELQSSCAGLEWSGIEVAGLTDPEHTILDVRNSFFTGTDHPLNIEEIAVVKILETGFAGDGTGTAVEMSKIIDFDISGNTFYNFENGLVTSRSQTPSAPTKIEKNIFERVNYAIKFSEDDHSELDIFCNRFDYQSYAIYSESTTLKSQGDATTGAGNEFTTTSDLDYNKLWNISDPDINYYYDPSYRISDGMNIILIEAENDRVCYEYNEERSQIQTTESTRKVMDVYAVPNPTEGAAVIYFSLGEQSQGSITITDINGKQMDRVMVNNGQESIQVDYSRFAPGIYLITLINSNGERKTNRLMIAD